MNKLANIFAGAIVLAAAQLATPAYADQPQTISYNYFGDPHWIHIAHPTVTTAKTYLPIVVYPGDGIYVRADGCVQTGGHGSTWKRYVLPSGANSSTLYHGQIQIPGAVEGLTNLSSLIGDHAAWSRYFAVGGVNNFPGQVALGYTDDGYSDNGYYSHDNGTENQCADNIDAYIELYICRGNAAHGATC